MQKLATYQKDDICKYIEANIACYETNDCCNDNAKTGLNQLATTTPGVADCPKKTCSTSPASTLRASAVSAVLAAAAVVLMVSR